MAKRLLAHNDYYVYILFRHDSVQPFYVGKGRGKRINQHLFDLKADGNKYKKAIIKQAKTAGRDVPGVKIATGLSEQEAFTLEIAFIAAIGRYPEGPLVNMTDGGQGSSAALIGNQYAKGKRWSLSDETRARQSLASRSRIYVGRPHTPETKAKISASQKGKIIPPEVIQKISLRFRGRKLPPEQAEKFRMASLGLKRSPETRERMRVARMAYLERQKQAND